MSDFETREELMAFLKSHGWDEESSAAFLEDKVGVRRLQIPGFGLLDVLQAVCKKGIPYGEISVNFLVPEGNWEAFAEAAREAIAKHGGFVLTPEEKAGLLDADPKIIN